MPNNDANAHCAKCLKIAPKVAFNNASEASYVYILSGQNLILNAKKKLETCGQTVLPDRLVVIEQKLWGFQIFRVIFNPMQLLVI